MLEVFSIGFFDRFRRKRAADGSKPVYGVAVTQQEQKRLTGIIVIVGLLVIISILFSSSTVAYYATVFFDGLVASGMAWAFIVAPIGFAVGYLYAKKRYWKINKMVIVPGLIRAHIYEFESESEGENGSKLFHLKDGRIMRVYEDFLSDFEDSYVWCPQKSRGIKNVVESKSVPIFEIESAGHMEMTKLNHSMNRNRLYEDELTHARQQSKILFEQIPTFLTAAMDPSRFAGQPQPQNPIQPQEARRNA